MLQIYMLTASDLRVERQTPQLVPSRVDAACRWSLRGPGSCFSTNAEPWEAIAHAVPLRRGSGLVSAPTARDVAEVHVSGLLLTP